MVLADEFGPIILFSISHALASANEYPSGNASDSKS
jgi:hypothetical protein